MIGNAFLCLSVMILRSLHYAVFFLLFSLQKICQSPIFLDIEGIFLLIHILFLGREVSRMEGNTAFLQSVCENSMLSRTKAFLRTLLKLFYRNITIAGYRNFVKPYAIRRKIQILSNILILCQITCTGTKIIGTSSLQSEDA